MPLLNLNIVQEDGESCPIQIDSNDAISKLHEYAEMVSGIPHTHQLLVLNNKPLQSSGSIGAAQVADGDLILVVQRTPEQRQQMQQQQQQVLRMVQMEWQQAAAAASAAPVDPLDPEYQRKMYEAIRQQNVEENWQQALEHSPEVFTQVEMLYVDMIVNSEPVKAFIDSGAQMTIMTAPCAEKCGIMRLMDTRYQGMAVGVGSSKILGKIHVCPVKVGTEHITTSITILEQKGGPQFIFGLDNLKRHNCGINLKTSMLEIGSCDIAVPFLPEHQVPKDFNVERQRSDAEEGEATGSGQPPAAAAAAGDAAAARAAQNGIATGADQPAAAPAPVPAAAPLTPPGAASDASAHETELAKQLGEITGADLNACLAALRATGGNIDLAAASLMGF